jgi:hypothetical protein
MAKINCWEHFKCGREVSPQDLSFDVCPAAKEASYDGGNGGKNAGRMCWAVFNTPCKTNEDSEKLDEGRVTCSICSFYKLVKEQEGVNFKDSKS